MYVWGAAVRALRAACSLAPAWPLALTQLETPEPHAAAADTEWNPFKHAQVSELLLRFPLLLTLGSEQLRASCDLLMAECRFASRTQLGELAGRHPELLLYGAQTLQVCVPGRCCSVRLNQRSVLGAQLYTCPNRQAPVNLQLLVASAFGLPITHRT